MPAGFLFAATNGKPATQDGLARVQTVTATEDHSARKASKSARGKASKTASKQKASSQANGGKKPTGRPSSYTEELGRRVCELLASGKPLTPKVTKENGLPDPTTIYRWTEDNEAFRMDYTRARQYQAHVYADQIIELADTAEDANLARIQVDTRKWYASKVIPKLYGDRQDIEVNHTVKIAEEHAAALIELSRRKREADTKIIDITPDASLNKGMHSESKQQVIELLPKIDTGSKDGEG